ncbi:hypothetical protein [Ruminococcus flavefaciens]|uniref:Secretory protein n=1 Tax=Ruminococcus flavefaciens 007c TaxID=1341157 RepID=W7UMD1_RUMFL|nr:hypothetical protein [Ruminococcus flavefaciens]EWM54958.1 hypothetical protein RF007C_02905 [Ruminococcus flavefaciens 007c]
MKKISVIITAAVMAAALFSCSMAEDDDKVSGTGSVAEVSTESVTESSEAPSEISISTEDESIPSFRLPFKAEDFDGIIDGLSVAVGGSDIIQKGTVDGMNYSITFQLGKWHRYTSNDQIVTLSKLFWQCYPKMYKRFGFVKGSPTDVSIAVEDDDYAISWTSGTHIHLNDRWLGENKTDFDCITHELVHVIQNGWDEAYLEYGAYIERFADYCRFLYAMDNGYYNDACWDLWTPEVENNRETSVRFMVWLDYFYSTPDNDLMKKFFTVCSEYKYPAAEWDAAWTEILSGSELEGHDIDDIWQMYTSSDFAKLKSEVRNEGEVSELLNAYDIRGKLTD